MPREPKAVRGERGPGGYRIWDNRRRRWWGDLYELCPDELLDELNGDADYQKLTDLLKRYRTQKR
jgi:hypothetical protein